MHLVRSDLGHGSEKFVLYRSDRIAAIGKIIFFTSAAAAHTGDARIVVLHVKKEFRGKDLGSLLFAECVQSLRCYGDERVLLDAEEDTSRHNKLISFYEQLGCQIKPNSRVQYINNNDGEIYRKVPMYRGIEYPLSAVSSSWLEGKEFLPLSLVDSCGQRLTVCGDVDRRYQWILVQDSNGGLCIRSTLGRYLSVDKNGSVHGEHTECESCEKITLLAVDLPGDVSLVGKDGDKKRRVCRRALWVLQSYHGTYIVCDTSGFLCSSQVPVFWQNEWRDDAGPEKTTIVCTRDTPRRRKYHRLAWGVQCVNFVILMRERYLSFDLKKMDIRQALDLVNNVSSIPFAMRKDGPSLRSLLYFTAEYMRKTGLPDWVQLLSLIHGLGRVVKIIDENFYQNEVDGYDYDWTHLQKSRPVGCTSLDDLNFPEYSELNPDSLNENYASALGMYSEHCGLQTLLFLWSGPEYMYHMISSEKSTIPEEGFAILRYFTFNGWHSGRCFRELCNIDDELIRHSVAEFDMFRRKARNLCTKNISNEECDYL
eukprot:CAMPEP_0194281200 /NCGR_PEP_ID=MMETSP0169-20130528/20196_1 /TAXON_ID=218684 /ORGANISM="Corethron pennatum, Strain L29A3" /LENGTH=537 /DNA_ID=CAMNT_0039026193 /DNA_START=210 /DNA_END=1820 /DNA_ORIENTATION=-